MRTTLTTLFLTAAFAAPAFAAGDAAKGETVFKQCQTCHVVADADGKVLAGKAGKVGPNLYGVIGRQAGTYPDFKYGDSMIAAGEKGLVWDEEHFVKYVEDPTGFLKDYLEDPKARGKMTFKVKNDTDAENVLAYIMSLSPAPEAAPASN